VAVSSRRRAALGLRGVVEVLVELVADDAVRVRHGRLALGALLLANLGLGLVVGGVGALDGLLELGQRRGTCGPASFFSALVAMSGCELQRVAGKRWLEGTTSRVACRSVAITFSARP
jgi:hypothetical protein